MLRKSQLTSWQVRTFPLFSMSRTCHKVSTSFDKSLRLFKQTCITHITGLQCAAVKIVFGPTIVPPHWWIQSNPSFRPSETIQGAFSMSLSTPPVMCAEEGILATPSNRPQISEILNAIEHNCLRKQKESGGKEWPSLTTKMFSIEKTQVAVSFLVDHVT